MTSTASLQTLEKIRNSGLRPTRQRLALAALLFDSGDRHVSAEALFEEAGRAGVHVSLATIYNTLNQFTRAGLLREVAIEGHRNYFDTNTSNHCHFYMEETGELVDIAQDSLSIAGLPATPPGTTIGQIDIVIRLKKTGN